MREETAINSENYGYKPYVDDLDTDERSPGWHVLWTRSNYERLVSDRLCAKGYEVFQPMITQWSGKGASRRLVRVPMFRGYLFLRHAVDKQSFLDVSNTDGVVCVLGASWDRLACVSEKEMEVIRLAGDSRIPAMPYPYLEKGDRVRVTQGTLKNAEGFLVESSPEQGLLVISIDMLNRSIALELDCSIVVPL